MYRKPQDIGHQPKSKEILDSYRKNLNPECLRVLNNSLTTKKRDTVDNSNSNALNYSSFSLAKHQQQQQHQQIVNKHKELFQKQKEGHFGKSGNGSNTERIMATTTNNGNNGVNHNHNNNNNNNGNETISFNDLTARRDDDDHYDPLKFQNNKQFTALIKNMYNATNQSDMSSDDHNGMTNISSS